MLYSPYTYNIVKVYNYKVLFQGQSTSNLYIRCTSYIKKQLIANSKAPTQTSKDVMVQRNTCILHTRETFKTRAGCSGLIWVNINLVTTWIFSDAFATIMTITLSVDEIKACTRAKQLMRRRYECPLGSILSGLSRSKVARPSCCWLLLPRQYGFPFAAERTYCTQLRTIAPLHVCVRLSAIAGLAISVAQRLSPSYYTTVRCRTGATRQLRTPRHIVDSPRAINLQVIGYTHLAMSVPRTVILCLPSLLTALPPNTSTYSPSAVSMYVQCINFSAVVYMDIIQMLVVLAIT